MTWHNLKISISLTPIFFFSEQDLQALMRTYIESKFVYHNFFSYTNNFVKIFSNSKKIEFERVGR